MAFAEKLEIVQLNAANEVVPLIDLNDDDHFLIKTGTFKVAAPVLQRVEAADQRRWGGSRQVGQTEENGAVSWEAGVTGDTEEECLAMLELLFAQLAANPFTTFLLWQPPGASEPTLYEMRGVGQYEPVYEPAQFGGAQLFVCQITIPVAPLAQGLPVQVLSSAATDLPAVFSITDVPGDAPAKAEVSIETGEDPTAAFITGAHEPCSLAVDGTYIYFANASTGYIGRAKLNGEAPNQTWLKATTGSGTLAGIAVNATHIFWVNNAGGYIGRATIAGAEVSSEWLYNNVAAMTAVAVNGTYVFWCAPYSIGRAKLNGEELDDTYLAAKAYEVGLAVSATYLYYSNEYGEIVFYSLVGEGKEAHYDKYIGIAGNAQNLAINGSYLYWGVPGGGYIGRATLSGAEPLAAWATAASPYGIAVNNERLFWSDKITGDIGRSVDLLEGDPPIWALLGWAAKPASGLATAPFGILDSSEGHILNGLTYEAVPSALNGKAFRGEGNGYLVNWGIDPATMVPDSFSGELSVEVWARVLQNDHVSDVLLTLSAQPEDGLGYGAARFTDEWGSAGRPLPNVTGGEVWRMTRLGTLHLLVNPLAPREWVLSLQGSATAGGEAQWGLDYLLVVPSTQRACSPSGKPNNSSYPGFIVNVGPTVKTIRHDLSALIGKPGSNGHPDHGLGGQLLEFPPGDTDLLVKLSSLVPDGPEENTASEQLAHEATVSVSVTPRFYLTRTV